MMARVGNPPASPGQESLYAAVKYLAAHSTVRRLLLIVGVALAAGLAVLLLIPYFWPVAALFGTVSSIGLWGLTTHAAARHPHRLLSWCRGLLVLSGTILAILAGIAIMFWILGPRWVL